MTDANAWRSYIGGEWIDGSGARELVDPSTGKVFAHASELDREATAKAVNAARRAFDDGRWSGLSDSQRRGLLTEVAEELARRTDQIAELERMNAGITIRLAAAMHVGLAVDHLRYFARAAEMTQRDEPLPGNDAPYTSMNRLVREPIGACAGIVPWNAPLMMAIWKVGPALAMGNTMVLKPSPLTPVTAVELARIVDESDIPDGVLNVVIGGDEVGRELAENPGIDRLAFTGSAHVGRQILAASANTFKNTSMELGGKSANILLDDVDIDVGVDAALYGMMVAQGQACEAGSRLLVPRGMHDEVVDRMVERLDRMVIGPTDDPATDFGPLISEEHRGRVQKYVELAQGEGANIAYGGDKPAHLDDGFYYEPTVITGATNELRVSQEEIFGPVLTVIPYEGEDQAVQIANDNSYGLAGGVWSQDPGRGVEVAKRIRAGTVWVNDYHVLSMDAPFGGYKHSGVGRELGLEGLLSYTESKHIHVGLAPYEHRPFSIVVPRAQ